MKKKLKSIFYLCIIFPVGISTLAFIISMLFKNLILNNTVLMIISSFLAELLIVLLICISNLQKKEKIFLKYKFKKFPLSKLPTIILATITITYFEYFIASYGSDVNSYKIIQKNINVMSNSPILIFYALLLGPIFEEIIFRDFIFSLFRKNFTTPIAIILESLSFGIFHQNILQGIYTFFFGLLVGCIFIYTENIYICIFMHIFSNSIALMLPSLLQFNTSTIILIIISLSIVTFLSYTLTNIKENSI